MIANVALALEYEATCKRPEHVAAAGLRSEEVEIFLAAVVAMADPVESHFLWRPQLRDPGDELVLEAAVNGRAAATLRGAPAIFAAARRRRFDADIRGRAGKTGAIGARPGSSA